MIRLLYAPSFAKQLKKLEVVLREEVFEKVELFKKESNHTLLKVHKLHGRFSDCFSFSVNYKIRVVFQYMNKNEVAILSIGNHDIYK